MPRVKRTNWGKPRRIADPGTISARQDHDGNPLLNARGQPYRRMGNAGGSVRKTITPDMPLGSFDRRKRARPGSTSAEKGKRDLWFLCSRVLSRVYPDLVESLHKPWCEFFVKKDPLHSVLIQDSVKNRMLLAPRGHFKTTINLCDIMQWMLAFPDITIVLFSGTEQLTARMVDEVKAHFLQNGEFREMYREWVPDEKVSEFGAKGSFTLPNRKMIRREPTLSITTLKSTRAGAHYDVEKFDDVVTEQNSKTSQQNQETSRQWSTTLPLLNPGGYRDVIGTLYTYDCFYGPILEREQKRARVDKVGWKVMQMGALRYAPDQDLFRPDAILFPERFCVDENEDPEKQNLQQIWRDDPELFASQYMNDPMGLASDQFSPARLKAHVIDRRDIPSTVNLYMTWDLAYSTTQRSDFSVGVLGGFSPDGSLFVVDMCRGRYRPAEVIEQIVQSYRKWPVCRVGIEKDQAAQMLAPGLEMRQRQMGLHIPVDMIPVKLQGVHPQQQILALGPLLEQNKLWFSQSMQDRDECFREFSRFPKYAHDDICRAVSLLCFYRNHGFRPELSPDPEPVYVGGAQVFGEGEGGAGINCG
jgi:predicted phage terminase large subunit-like protein